MLTRAALFAFCIFLPSQLIAQSVPSVPTNTAFRVIANHDGVATTGYRVYLDTVKHGADIPVSARQANGEVTFNIAGIPAAGPHRVEVTAFNDAGESAKLPLAFQVGPPSVPSGIRIVITTSAEAVVEPQPDGTFKLRIEGVNAAAVVK
jgi:hypothetical protein